MTVVTTICYKLLRLAREFLSVTSSVTSSLGLNLERVMNLDENRIEMRIPRSAWFLRDLRFPHS